MPSAREVEVGRVRVEQKVSYAEAMKRVEDDGSRSPLIMILSSITLHTV